MARNKENETQDVSVFPDGYTMNAWDDGGREVGIAADRTRTDEKRIYAQPNTRYRNKGRLDFPVDQIPQGWQYAFMTERLLGEPQQDNLQMRYEEGWEFVKQSDHPTYLLRELYENPDNRIRKYNCVLMKKPKHEYEKSQREYEEESLARQREIVALTGYLGNSPNDPRFVVENSGSYTPNYRHQRG